MEKIVLTIGGLLKSFSWSDIFFFIVTLVLILLLIYIIFLIKTEKEEIKQDMSTRNIKEQKIPATNHQKENKKDRSLTDIVNVLETEYKPKPIDLSEYEKEQENTAIISYEELLSKTSNNIYYDDNYQSGFDDIIVQKIDNKESKTQELVDLPRAIMMSYESEEAFLSALKSLQKNLVR